MADLGPYYRAAAELIEEKGWTRGQFHDDSGCLCASGALALAVGGWFSQARVVFPDDTARSLWTDLCEYAERSIGPDDLPRWNDSHTADEVVALLTRLAEEWDLDGGDDPDV